MLSCAHMDDEGCLVVSRLGILNTLRDYPNIGLGPVAPEWRTISLIIALFRGYSLIPLKWSSKGLLQVFVK